MQITISPSWLTAGRGIFFAPAKNIFFKKKRKKSLDETIKIVYTMSVLRAILELIGKCESLEELRESVQRIMG